MRDILSYFRWQSKLTYANYLCCRLNKVVLQHTGHPFGFTEYLYEIQSDHKPHVNFNTVASIKLLLSHIIPQSLLEPSIKTECKIGRLKDYYSPLWQKTHSLILGGKYVPAKGAQSPEWRMALLGHNDGVAPTGRQERPSTVTGAAWKHTSRTYTLWAWFVLFLR